MSEWKERNRLPRAGFLVGLLVLLALVLVVLVLTTSLSPSHQHLESTSSREAGSEEAQKGWLVFSSSLTNDEDSTLSENTLATTTTADPETRSERRTRRSTLYGSAKLSTATTTTSTTKRLRRLTRLERRPILNEFSFPANLVQGMRFVLMCQVLDGEQPVRIKWFKDNQELAGQQQPLLHQLPGQQQLIEQTVSVDPKSTIELEQVELVQSEELGGSSLVFRRVLRQHGGNYTCLANNLYGSTSYSSIMSVKVPPQWRIEPQDQESIMGQQISIDCQASGNPNPFIRWKFAAGLLPSSSTGNQQRLMMEPPADTSAPTSVLLSSSTSSNQQNFRLINSNHHVQTLENGSLSIKQVAKEHEGFYLCEADNGVEPNLIKVLRLLVHLPAQFLDDIQLVDSSPSSSQQMDKLSTGSGMPKSMRVAQNTSQLRLLCQPFGQLPLTIEWLKDGQLIYTHTAPALDPQAQPATSVLVGHQTVGQLTADLSSRYHVNTRRAQHRPNGAQSTVAIQSGQLDTELVVTNLRRSDGGLFACQARNAFGQAERKLRLLVQEPPEEPEVVDVAHISSRSIGLRWLAPFDGNSPILKYLVEYRRQSESLNANPTSANGATTESSELLAPALLSEKVMPLKSLVEPPSSGSQSLQSQQQHALQVQHTLHELEPLSRYSIRVVAVNALGRSRPSVSLSLRTEEEVPSVLPSSVEAIVLSSRSIKLHWTISYSPEHEIIDGFFVGYRSLEAASASGELQATIQGAVSGKGDQQQAEQQTFTYKTIRLTNQQQRNELQDAELGRQDRLDASSFLSPISSVTKHVPVQQQQQQSQIGLASNLSPNSQLSSQVVVVSTFEYVVKGLERNTEYTILIQCFNRKGAGPTSDPVVFKTFVNDPPEKLSLSAEDISESSIKVNWRFVSNPSDYLSSATKQSSDPVDGYVLTYAKLASTQRRVQTTDTTNISTVRHHHSIETSVRSMDQLSNRESAARISGHLSTDLTQPINGVDQWQAVQLAPQQRSHHLKNLECGTQYGIKIWAFNKIGKGEPSDLVSVSTRGKAPIAPDRRSFITVNSTQVRLHLSAWYDGGCEIEKFIVKYRARGQQEWILVSNNIPREQVSVAIRDLLPATTYELIVGATNQVGLTEVRYRFTTLDNEGRQVFMSHSYLGNSPSLDEDADYMTDGDGTKREFWPHSDSTSYRSLATMLHHLLNSPIALILSLFFFVVLLLLLLFYGFGGLSSTSTTTLSLSNKSSSNGRRSSGEANTTILDGEGPMSIAPDGSITDSPRMNIQLQASKHYGIAGSSECHYQSFCGTNHQHPPSDYGRSTLPNRIDCSPYVQTNYVNPANSHYPIEGTTELNAVQRSATTEPINGGLNFDTNQSSEQQQQCLMQMLMLGSNQQNGSIASNQGENTDSYVANALTTLARSKVKINSNHYHHGNGNATLARPYVDYQRLQQDPYNSNNDNEAYPMSTFKGCKDTFQTMRTPDNNYGGSNSTASTSGCGTATSSGIGENPEHNSNLRAKGNLLYPFHDNPIKRNTEPKKRISFDQNYCDTNSPHYDVPLRWPNQEIATIGVANRS